MKRLFRPLICLFTHAPYTDWLVTGYWCSRCNTWYGQARW